jgi:hypothetical protein
MRRLRGKSPVALTLTGATALCDLVARRRRNAPPPGKSPAQRYRLPGLLNGTKVRTLTHCAFAQAGFQLVVLIDHVLFRRAR